MEVFVESDAPGSAYRKIRAVCNKLEHEAQSQEEKDFVITFSLFLGDLLVTKLTFNNKIRNDFFQKAIESVGEVFPHDKL
jgi:hypothetical protein